MKTLSQIENDYHNGVYSNKENAPARLKIPSNGVLDEDQSVKWNKEECGRLIKEREEKMSEYYKGRAAKTAQMRLDIENAIAKERNISIEKARVIESFAWGEYGEDPDLIYDYFNRIDDFADFALLFSKTE